MIAVDEAARLTEPEHWPMLAWFEPRSIPLVAAHQQLDRSPRRHDENTFQSQLGIFFVTQLKLNGFMDVMFTEPHRMVNQPIRPGFT
jgi:hypothetical protein